MEQIKKNTVAVRNQIKATENVQFDGSDRDDLRILFVGNSITCHGIKPEIGWLNHWGMAASKRENDYVHLCISKIRETRPRAAFCICQAWQWEADYKNGSAKQQLYEAARSFHADIIVMRVVENCAVDACDREIFIQEYDSLIRYLNPDGKAKVILTTGFWRHPADALIREYAQDRKMQLCELGDLGEQDEMKAVGQFAHEGVANHPGDLGMRMIAERICGAIQEAGI